MDRLPKCGANYVPLTPTTFLLRASKCYADRKSVIYGGVSFTWRQTYDRCCRLASSLRALNVVKNDVVSVLAPNVPAMYEMHFAVPMAGAVLNTINTRLDAKNIATILRHSEAKVFFVDYEYVEKAGKAMELLMEENTQMPLVVVIDDVDTPTGIRLGELEYEQLVLQGNPNTAPEEINDEWDAITLSYTSGTTSDPKGVVYSHRGAFLSTLSLILGWEMGTEPVYLWSLPMFHCNGWTFTWGVAARGGTNVCIRNTAAKEMYDAIAVHKVTHMCCAPIVFNILLEAKAHERRNLGAPVQILTGGAPPPPSLLKKIEQLGFYVVHAYGLTEATGPALVCEWQGKWNLLPKEEQADLKARQGLSILTLADAEVMSDLKTMKTVPRDGKTMGEIVLRGSSIMKGYYKNAKANSESFVNGWFVTGDVGVIHPDGYLEIKDRSKDVIISGGENISSVDVEKAIMKHPNVSEVAVVAMPHPRWGESPCAFVVEKSAGKLKEAEIVAHCRKTLPGFMVPKKIQIEKDLPKTSTGKPLKHLLRAKAKTFVISENVNEPSTSSKRSNQVNREKPRFYDQPPEQVLAISRL